MMVAFLLLLAVLLPACHGNVGSPRPLTQVELRHDTHQSIMKVLVQEYNKRSNSASFYVLYNVEEATEQVVAGILFNYTLILVPSGCRKNAPAADQEMTLKSCSIGNGHVERCQATHYTQPLLIHGVPIQKISINCQRAEDLTLHENLFHTGHDEVGVGNLQQFLAFTNRFNKQYDNVEFNNRYKIFKRNMKKAALLNMMELGSGQYGMTAFSDLTEEEFKQRLSSAWDLKNLPQDKAAQLNISTLPDDFDWRTKGAVTGVKNQGQCGSCWAFSTTGNVEGQWFVKNGQLVSLSEQELVDCDVVDHACNGGLPTNAYKEIIRLGGLTTDQVYPYQGKQGTCRFQASQAAVYINGSVLISSDETQMAAWLVKNGPISIGINANAMQFYRGGVSHPWSILCNKHELNHGVLIVGYGVSKSEPYWIVKNSWGTSWGQEGYYYVYRGDGTCGLNTMATSAVIN